MHVPRIYNLYTSYTIENTDYLTPTRRLQVTYSAPTTLLFNLFRNHYYRNKPIDALVL